MAQAASNRLGAQAEVDELLEAGDRRAGVHDLMRADQGGRWEIEIPALAGVSHSEARGIAAPLVPIPVKRRGEGTGPSLDEGFRLFRLRPNDRCHAGLQDPCLLAGNRRDGVTEKSLMVERDGCDCGYRR